MSVLALLIKRKGYDMAKQSRVLSVEKKEYYRRLNVIIAEGLRVFGDLHTLLEWMRTRNEHLGGERPNELMEQSGGFDKIYKLLSETETKDCG
jgi:uncharacterized protein (DUF2384 family)